MHHSAPKNSLIALLIETCQSKTPFTFNIYLKKALEFEINLNENIDNSKCNIFYLACQNGQHEMVASLLLHNVDINILSGQQVTAFDIACIQGHEKVVRLFLNKDVNINRYVRGCMPIIFKVIYEDKLAVFEELLSFPGINLNKFDIKNADTPLTYAIFQRKTKMAKLLIAHGADVNLKNEKGANAFHRACYYGETEIMEELLKINPEFINMPDDKGTTPAWICSEIDNTKVTEILIKNGADFKRIIHNNMSPATNAIKKGNNTTLMMALNQAPEQPANTEESMPEATASFKI